MCEDVCVHVPVLPLTVSLINVSPFNQVLLSLISVSMSAALRKGLW